LLDIHLFPAVKIVLFGCWGEITNQPKSKQITFHREDFAYQVLRNYLACPHGVKYESISEAHTVDTLNNYLPDYFLINFPKMNLGTIEEVGPVLPEVLPILL
jgi:hypothetical protein